MNTFVPVVWPARLHFFTLIRFEKNMQIDSILMATESVWFFNDFFSHKRILIPRCIYAKFHFQIELIYVNGFIVVKVFTVFDELRLFYLFFSSSFSFIWNLDHVQPNKLLSQIPVLRTQPQSLN